MVLPDTSPPPPTPKIKKPQPKWLAQAILKWPMFEGAKFEGANLGCWGPGKKSHVPNGTNGT